MTGSADVLDDGGAADAGKRLLPRGVDVEHEDLVGGAERCAELGRESGCARIQVGLESDDDPATGLVDHGAGRLEGSPDFGRMVRVVIEHSDPAV